MHRLFSALLTLGLLLSACSGPRGTTAPADAPAPLPAPEAPVDHAAYEDFDPAPYREDAAAGTREVQHDVPERLMKGTAGTGVARTGAGFRVQVFQSLDKSAADAKWEEAIAWWREQQEAGAAPAVFGRGQPAVYVTYRQPYYRVRVGNFGSRLDAQQALRRIQVSFPGASIVPDTVTLTP